MLKNADVCDRLMCTGLQLREDTRTLTVFATICQKHSQLRTSFSGQWTVIVYYGNDASQHTSDFVRQMLYDLGHSSWLDSLGLGREDLVCYFFFLTAQKKKSIMVQL